MNLIKPLIMILILSSSQTFCQEEHLSPEQEMGRYIGFTIGKQFVDSDVSLEDIITGIQAIKNDDAPSFDLEKCQTLFCQIQRKCFDEKASSNLAKSREYLFKVSQDPQIVEVIPEKLYAKIVNEGSGQNHLSNSGIFHITCQTIDDQTLIDTRTSSQPVKQDLDEAIEGFAIGVKGMKLRERRILYIHPSLAYQDTNWVEPNMALIIDVEFVSESLPALRN